MKEKFWKQDQEGLLIQGVLWGPGRRGNKEWLPVSD